MKESFIIHNSFYGPIKTLNDEQLGRLFRAIFEYEINGIDKVDSDIMMAFLFFKNQLDIDHGKYVEMCRKRAENGSKGGLAKAKASKSSNCLQKEQKLAKVADNDNDNDNEYENNVIDKSITIKNKNIKKKKYGKYGNVLLSDEEVSKITTEEDGDKIIEFFSEMKEMKGYTYKNDYLAINRWGKTAYYEQVNKKNGAVREFSNGVAQNNRTSRDSLAEMAAAVLRGAEA